MFLSRCVHILWLIVYICYVSGNKDNEDNRKILDGLEDKFNAQIKLMEICRSANLIVLAYSDSRMKNVLVFFKLSDSKFKDCFRYFNISLEKKRRRMYLANVSYRQNKVSHIFENVTCGIYEVVIEPYYNDWQPAHWKFRHPKLINVTSDDCVDNFRKRGTNKFIKDENIKKNIIIIIAVVSVALVFAVGGLVYFYYSRVKSKEGKGKDIKNYFESETVCPADTTNQEVTDIHVKIFHYYNKKNAIQRKVEDLTDFLQKSSYFRSVRLTESELHKILVDPGLWLNETLQEKDKDGSNIKIIIIISEPENGDEEYERNRICTQAIKTLDNDLCRILEGYHNLFVVRFKDTLVDCMRLSNFVQGARYTIPVNAVELCRDLCTGSVSNLFEVEKNIRQLYSKHKLSQM